MEISDEEVADLILEAAVEWVEYPFLEGEFGAQQVKASWNWSQDTGGWAGVTLLSTDRTEEYGTWEITVTARRIR